MKIAIGGDHAGFQLKLIFIDKLNSLGHAVEDLGPFSEESCDYPDFAHQVGSGVQKKDFDLGIVICGSGNGVNMVANKYPDVRSALCWDTELAFMAKAHNNANILAVPARYVSEEKALYILNEFLNTPFEGGRHEKRVNKISCS
jgi:ribose 5-phosphate isomerase B